MVCCTVKVYTRYRFLQRETRWKGLEDSLDECIDESMRTLDQVGNAFFVGVCTVFDAVGASCVIFVVGCGVPIFPRVVSA